MPAEKLPPFDGLPDTFDFDGSRISAAEWIRRTREDPQWRVFARTGVAGLMVSTVLLPLDHGLGLTDRPIIFETMIFRPDEDGLTGGGGMKPLQVPSLERWQERYCTLADAKLGHEAAVVACEVALGEKRKLHIERTFPAPPSSRCPGCDQDRPCDQQDPRGGDAKLCWFCREELAVKQKQLPDRIG